MLAVLGITLPIYLAVLAGFGTTKAGLFQREHMKVFSRFVVYIALPATVFTAVAGRDFDEIIDPTYVAANALGSLVVIGIALFYGRVLSRRSLTSAAYDAMGAVCPNSGFIGYPLMLLVLPTVAAPAVGMDMIVENVLLIPLTLTLMEVGAGGATAGTVVRIAAQRMVRQPLLWAIAAALTVSISGLQLPAVLTDTVGLFAQAATAVALFTVGGLLTGLNISGAVMRLVVGTVLKLLIHPAALALAALGLTALGMPELSPELFAALVLTGALPALSVFPTFALRHGEEQHASAALMTTTVLSFVTITGLLTLFDLV